MAQPEFSGGGENQDEIQAFWDLVGRLDPELEAQIPRENKSLIRLLTAQACFTANPAMGEAFR